MQTQKTSAAGKSDGNVKTELINLTRRIGSTTYVVTVHFSQTSKETLEDKLIRLMEREAKDIA